MSRKLHPDFIKYIKETHSAEEAEKTIKEFENNKFIHEVADGIAELLGIESPYSENYQSDTPKGEQAKEDLVNHPKHYEMVTARLEPIDILRYAPFDLGNALKYILRAPYKDNALLDYQKALKYLEWAKESYENDKNKPYDYFFIDYGLLLKKFEVFKEIPFEELDGYDIIPTLIRLVVTKIEELQK